MKRLLPLSALMLAFIACGDSGTGPSPVDIDGTWRFNYLNMSTTVNGTTVSCDVTALDFAITQTGNTFSGVQEGAGSMTCSANGQAVADGLVGNETIVNGQVDGNSISFRLGTIDGQHSGTVTDTSMSGTAQWVIPSGGVSFTLNGQFNGAKL